MKYLIYVTKAKPMLENHKRNDNKYHCLSNLYDLKWCNKNNIGVLNGKIVAEFDGEVEEIKYIVGSPFPYLDFESELSKTCLSDEELENYLFPNNGYAIHINNLKVFDKPLTIEALYQPIDNNFCKECREYNTCEYAKSKCKPCKKVLLSAPQNMCYVWYKGERCCLISIRPEWVCKIVNGEKKIEVRKKVLKGCL